MSNWKKICCVVIAVLLVLSLGYLWIWQKNKTMQTAYLHPNLKIHKTHKVNVASNIKIDAKDAQMTHNTDGSWTLNGNFSVLDLSKFDIRDTEDSTSKVQLPPEKQYDWIVGGGINPLNTFEWYARVDRRILGTVYVSGGWYFDRAGIGVAVLF